MHARCCTPLSQGKDVSSWPIIVAAPAGGRTGAGAAAEPNPVTPTKMLAIVVAAIVIVGGSAGGYWAWSRGQAQQAEQIRLAAEQTRVAETKQRAADAERQRLLAETQAEKSKAATALREAEAAKQKAASQQAELTAQAEALKQREQAAPAPSATPAPTATAVAVAGADDWAAMLKQALPHLRTMLDAALVNGGETVVRESAAIRALPQPARGDRKLARARNAEGLAALNANDPSRAAASLAAGVAADPADEEVATNLGYALVKAGRHAEAQNALQRALYLNPTRSSAWYPLGVSFASQNREQQAYAAFLLTYQFAGIQQKSRDHFEKLAQDPTDPLLQRLARRLVETPAVLASSRPPEGAVQIQQVAAVATTPAIAAPVAAEPARAAKSSLQEFCGGKSNIFKQASCESKECRKPENRADPYCAAFLKRPDNNR